MKAMTDNELRAARAEDGLEGYAEAVGYMEELEADPLHVASDFITDLLHFATRYPGDPLAIIDRAIADYREERTRPQRLNV